MGLTVMPPGNDLPQAGLVDDDLFALAGLSNCVLLELTSERRRCCRQDR